MNNFEINNLLNIPKRMGVQIDLIDFDAHIDSTLSYNENKLIITNLCIPLSEQPINNKYLDRQNSKIVRAMNKIVCCVYCNEITEKTKDGYKHRLGCQMIHTACKKFNVPKIIEEQIREKTIDCFEELKPKDWKQKKIIIGVLLWQLGNIKQNAIKRRIDVSPRSLSRWRDKVMKIVNGE